MSMVEEWVAPVLLSLLGACVGSFLNVVVYRLPRGLSVQDPPRSFCPSCGASIPWWLNLPIISWLWLRGRSACCHKPIAVRYWLVEVACTALFLLISLSFAYESLLTQVWLCLWAAALLALLAMDLELMVVDARVAVFAACFGLAVAVADPALRHKVWRGLNTDEVAEPNAFAADAAVAAFTKGGPWLDELREYVSENKRVTVEFLARELPQVKAVPSQATYLIWLDCTALPGDTTDLAQFIREKTGLFMNGGAQYSGNGKYFLRLNVACPRSRLEDGLARLKRGVLAWEQEKG